MKKDEEVKKVLSRARRARDSLEQELLKHSTSCESGAESRHEVHRPLKILARSDCFEETDTGDEKSVSSPDQSSEAQSSLPVKRKTVRYQACRAESDGFGRINYKKRFY